MAQAHHMGLERKDDCSVGNPEKAGPGSPLYSLLAMGVQGAAGQRPGRHLAPRSPQSDRETDMWACHPIRTKTMAFHKRSPCRLALSNSTWFNSSSHQDPWEDGQTIIP